MLVLEWADMNCTSTAAKISPVQSAVSVREPTLNSPSICSILGKETYLPSYSAWYGASDKLRTHSGLTLYPKKWNKELLYVRDKINDVANVQFNGVLINWHRDGDDSINWHADDERSLGLNPVVGSVNFGETRDFVLKKCDKSEKLTIPVKHGTLLIMRGELQHFWEHSVPKRTKIKHDRINLTF